MTRPWLIERFCADPNPHGPHPWPKADADEDARYWCRGVDEALSTLIHNMLGGWLG